MGADSRNMIVDFSNPTSIDAPVNRDPYTVFVSTDFERKSCARTAKIVSLPSMLAYGSYACLSAYAHSFRFYCAEFRVCPAPDVYSRVDEEFHWIRNTGYFQ